MHLISDIEVGAIPDYKPFRSFAVHEAKMRDSETSRRVEPEPSASILARRHFNGLAFLSAGFRPFFWGAGLWAVISMGIWLLVLNEQMEAPVHFDMVAWHAHEMLFGFASAAMAGFLLTAVPNWTGRLPVRGFALAGLAGIWLAGRAAMLFGAYLGNWLAGGIDLSFLAIFFAFIMREILIGKNWRNLPVAAVLFVFLAANLTMHLDNAGVLESDGAGWRLGIMTIIMLMSLIGGRITPSFTRNWLAKSGMEARPAGFGWPDKAALAATGAAALFWVVTPDLAVTGGLLATAAGLQLFRLSRWCGYRTFKEPLVLVLHVGYAWIPAGLALLGVSILADLLPFRDALHGLTIGAVGTMIVAVMTRASLGHSGRPLTAGWGTSVVYLLVIAAVITRILAMAGTESYMLHINVSGFEWIAAFVLFLTLYSPLYFRKRR